MCAASKGKIRLSDPCGSDPRDQAQPCSNYIISGVFIDYCMVLEKNMRGSDNFNMDMFLSGGF